MRGAIAWPLVLVVGVPLLAGALVGWRIAHAVPTERLRSLLAVVARSRSARTSSFTTRSVAPG